MSIGSMAAWSSKGRAFEYACGLSVDEEIIPDCYRRRVVYFAVEVRTNFVVGEEEKRWLGSERFGAVFHCEELMRKGLGVRLRDYWMSPPQIKELLDAVMLFAGAAGERPTVLDLEVCTVQEEGEPLEAALARAMRPATLRPLDLTDPMLINTNPKREELFNVQEAPRIGPDNDFDLEAMWRNMDMVDFLRQTLYDEGVRVDNVDEGLAVMQQCGICGGQPFVGTHIARLRCAHLFHYHCVVWPLKDHRACPNCGHPPYDLQPVPIKRLPCPAHLKE